MLLFLAVLALCVFSFLVFFSSMVLGAWRSITIVWDKAVAVETSVVLMAFGLGMMWESIPLVQWDNNVHMFVRDTMRQWLNTCASAMFILVWMRAARYWNCTMGQAFMNGLMCGAKALRLTVKILRRDNTSTWAAFWIIALLSFAFGHNIVYMWSN